MSDLISRQAAIDAIERHLHSILDGTHYDEGIAFGYEAAHRHIIDVIHDLSSAQRKGKWIQKNKNLAPLNAIWWFECSECGKHAYNDILSEYCPCCGAEMNISEG